MKFRTQISVLLITTIGAMSVVAQTIPQGTFKHIIIVVQENRTPDNLFGAGTPSGLCGGQDDFEPGVDIENGGPNNNGQNPTCNMSLPLSAWDAEVLNSNGTHGRIIDPDHSYNDDDSGKNRNPWGWVADYDGGARDGFCHEYGAGVINAPHPCPSYSYVQKSDVQPYFDIASTYSFANYMFQTNEGPSFPAHQFLFTGTSAPVAPGNHPDDLDFIAELAGSSDYGCPYSIAPPEWVHPDGSEFPMSSYPECYTHDSLVTTSANCTQNGGDSCDRGLTWAYYMQLDRAIWDAPASIPEVCYGQNSPYGTNACGSGPYGNSTEWADHVHFPNPGVTNGSAPIFSDLYNCGKDMPQITWVIPDMFWSDHPIDAGPPFNGGPNSPSCGPSWVGDIINAVGQACNGKYWDVNQEPTAVFVVWDDWGGWYDHIAPWAYYRGTSSSCPSTPPYNVPNGWGCGYTSGFRVPLLVVSPYTGSVNGQTYSSYVSGACGASPLPNCPNKVFPYIHDFGSILAFTEYNFNMPNIDQSGDNGYADLNAPDNRPPYVPLSDFFGLYPTPRPFVSISTPKDYTFFENYYQTTGTSPVGPDYDDLADD